MMSIKASPVIVVELVVVVVVGLIALVAAVVAVADAVVVVAEVVVAVVVVVVIGVCVVFGAFTISLLSWFPSLFCGLVFFSSHGLNCVVSVAIGAAFRIMKFAEEI